MFCLLDFNLIDLAFMTNLNNFYTYEFGLMNISSRKGAKTQNFELKPFNDTNTFLNDFIGFSTILNQPNILRAPFSHQAGKRDIFMNTTG